MKSNKSLTLLYPKLKADERFRLTMSALVRKDETEVERLRRSCPRKRYEQADAEYVDRVEATRLVAANFTILWLEAHHRFTVAEMMLSGHVRDDAELADCAPCDKPVLEVALRFQKGTAAGALLAAAAFMKATADGLMRFAKDAGIDADAVLVWYAPIGNVMRTAIAALPRGLPRDKEREDLVFDILRDDWAPFAGRMSM